jgi:chromate transporter
MQTLEPAHKPSFGEALRFWSKLGWISFGGTAAHIALMHDHCVEQEKWISNGRFLHALSHCMILPGPEAQQLAIYIGWKLHGKKGGLAAGTLFVLPSMFVILALSVIYVRFGALPWISAMFNGLKPAVIALVILALFRIGARALRGPVQWVVGALAFIAMYFFSVSLLLIMLAAVIFGGLLGHFRPSLFHHQDTIRDADDERSYYINRYSSDPESRIDPASIAKLIAGAVVLWLIPFALLYLFAPDFSFWTSLSLFFTKTAFVTLGGSYTVIPYVAQIAVMKLHWLTKLQMTDGFALAETTPGPLIIVVAFVGFMAAYNHFHGSLWMGTLGLLATTFYTFLPCFLFVFAGAPMVERTQGKPAIEAILGLITAVVVGAILDLTLFLGRGVIFTSGAVTLHTLDVVSAAWVLISLLLLKKFKLNVIYLILLSIAFGAVRYLVGSHIG